MKVGKAILSCLLTLALLITPFSGVLVFAWDGTGPRIEVNLSDLQQVTANTAIEIGFFANPEDIASCDTRLEGTSISTDAVFSFTPAEKELTNGSYTLVMQATDTQGNTNIRTISFKVVDSLENAYDISETGDANAPYSLTVSKDSTVKVNDAEPLNFAAGFGSTQDGVINPGNTNTLDDLSKYNIQYGTDAVTTESSTGIPYQTFDVQLNGKTDGDVAIRYSGSTAAGERVALKVQNPTTTGWDTVGTFTGSGSVSAKVDVATYADNGVIHAAAILDYVTNGSDSFIWVTDPQHYTKFEDLNEYYYQVYQYAAAQYLAGEAGYVMNTGDIVDDRPDNVLAEGQWQIADKAMQYVEDVNMPNGLVTGNHDVGDYNYPDYVSQQNTTSDYSMFGKYFGSSRYNTKDWYGGSLNNNTDHYDLITIGNVDFVVLYLGYGMEATDETIVWANQVLQTYSHRNAIIATHQYIKNSTAAYYSNSRAQLIFDKIVDPNSNVKMVLCGHDDGAQILEKTASDGRTVYEILSDYQFVQAEDSDFYNGEGHYIGAVPDCCGDGYLRTMTVTGNTLASITYSPVTGGTNPYGDRETFSLDIGFDEADRQLVTTGFSAAAVGDTELLSSDMTAGTATPITGTQWVAEITDTATGSVSYTAVTYASVPEAPTGIFYNVPNDFAALNTLIERAEAIEPGNYTEESFGNMQTALTDAKNLNIAASDNAMVVDTYRKLINSIGLLTEKKDSIDPSTLESLFNYDLTISKWKSTDANVPLTDAASYITATATQAGGMNLVASAAAKNEWPSALYTGGNVVLHPNNGKIYANIDVDANSSWCMYLEVEQGSSSASLRLNHAIEHFYKTSSDGFAGSYHGVYDVTDAFVQAGFDPTCTITITGTLLYVVPGDVTYDHFEFLTDPTTGAVDKTALQEAIDSVADLTEADYTLGSWKKLSTALTAANKSLADETLLQSDVNLATAELKKAISKLKLTSELVPEPENSLLPADEGLWVPNNASAMDVYRNDDNYTVLQNTNSQWPYADYTEPTAVTATVADTQVTMDVTVGAKTNIYMMIDGTWISMCKYLSEANTNADGDLTAGTYTVGIPLSGIPQLKDKETVSIQKLRVYSVGDAASSGVIIRQWSLDPYVAPPYIEETLANMMPQSEDEIEHISGEGSHSLNSGVLNVHSTQDYRLNTYPTPLYNMSKLNGLHLVIDTNVPFKIAIQIKSADNATQAWPNTSDASLSNIFTVENDRIIAGHYDVTFNLADMCATITDKSSVYYAQFIIVTSGEGNFRMSTCEAVKYSNFNWDESLTYGEAATPDNPYYAHAAKEAPKVAEKVDVLEKLGLSEHPTIAQWDSYGDNSALKMSIDLTKTPYLYLSVAQADTSSFTFAFYNDNTGYKVPWFIFRDASKEGAAMTTGAANWDLFQNAEQYVVGSETICVDMRDYLSDPTCTTWTVNMIRFYNYLHQNAVISYMFFGSEPIEAQTVIGDLSGDGTVNTRDAMLLYQATAGQIELTDAQLAVADVNGDGDVTAEDALLLYRVAAGLAVLPAA